MREQPRMGPSVVVAQSMAQIPNPTRTLSIHPSITLLLYTLVHSAVIMYHFSLFKCPQSIFGLVLVWFFFFFSFSSKLELGFGSDLKIYI